MNENFDKSLEELDKIRSEMKKDDFFEIIRQSILELYERIEKLEKKNEQ